jgi:hypothetical protein
VCCAFSAITLPVLDQPDSDSNAQVWLSTNADRVVAVSETESTLLEQANGVPQIAANITSMFLVRIISLLLGCGGNPICVKAPAEVHLQECVTRLKGSEKRGTGSELVEDRTFRTFRAIESQAATAA